MMKRRAVMSYSGSQKALGAASERHKALTFTSIAVVPFARPSIRTTGCTGSARPLMLIARAP